MVENGEDGRRGTLDGGGSSESDEKNLSCIFALTVLGDAGSRADGRREVGDNGDDARRR